MLVADFDTLLDHFARADRFQIVNYGSKYTRLFIEGQVFMLTLGQRVQINSFLSFIGRTNWKQYQGFNIVSSWCNTEEDFKYIVNVHKKMSDKLLAKHSWYREEETCDYQSLYPLRLAYYLQVLGTKPDVTFNAPTKIWRFRVYYTVGLKAIATVDLNGTPIAGILTYRHIKPRGETEMRIWFPKAVAGHVMYLREW